MAVTGSGRYRIMARLAQIRPTIAAPPAASAKASTKAMAVPSLSPAANECAAGETACVAVAMPRLTFSPRTAVASRAL
jgi:hypothetical protein